jgi:NAD(P)-dependent dehydrogenase (short-subunit alcohol dehydrogenase family)
MKTYSRHDFTREERAARAKVAISAAFESKEQAFLDFVLSHYVRVGVQELDQEKLTPLLRLKYNNSIADAVAHLGKPEDIGRVRIDVLVNNAGYGLITAFEEMSPEQIHQQFATNVYGVMNVTRAVLPVMRRQRSGHLFTIASMGGYLGGSRGTAYAASKFAVAGFTESLALELEEFGITATIVGPGYFRTDFLDKSSAILEPATLIEDYRASNAAFRAATETANHAQQGDPNALGRLLVEIAAERKPPLHLPVGADAVQLVEQHHNSVLNDIKAWRAKSSNTAFNAG